MRFLKIIPFILLAVLFGAFAVNNRETVTVSLFPLPYTAELAVFVLAVICLLLGAGIAALAATLSLFRYKLEIAASKRRIEALENEVGGLRAERNILPPPRNDPR